MGFPGGSPPTRNNAALLIVLLFVTLAFAPSAFAQITAATVSGTIRDQTGAVLPGVDVVVDNPNTA